MGEDKPKAVKKAAASSEAAAPAKKAAKGPNDVVKVKNICKKNVPTSKGVIQPGKEGKATVAEVRSLHKYIKEV